MDYTSTFLSQTSHKTDANFHLMHFPKITIVTPVFNQEKFLEKTIKSIIDQEYPNLEYIIIDGGSTDRTIEIIKKHENCLAWWVSEPDKGMYDAVQKGFRNSSGEIMGWLNSDDMLHPAGLATLAEIFSNFNEIDWIQGRPILYDEKDIAFHVGPLRKWTKYHFYAGRYKWIQQESTFWRRSLWEKAGGFVNSDLKYAGDFELWLRFFRHAKMFSTSGLISGFRFRKDGQLSQRFLKEYLLEVEACLKKELETLNPKDKIITKQLQLALFFQDFLKKIRIFNYNPIQRLIIERITDAPPIVAYDIEKQEFVYRDWY